MTGRDFFDRYGPAALVTGASSGIGEAFAAELAAHGCDLVLVARRADRLKRLADELSRRHGVRVTAITADLTERGAVEQIVAQTEQHDLGLVVSNAGFSMKGRHEDNDPALLTDMLMVNCHAPLQLTRALIPRLRARSARGSRGGIVLTSSVEGLIGCPFSAAYSASKALVKALGEALWAELRECGIDVLTLCPGATDTEGAASSGFDMAKMQGVLKPADVAAQALEHIADGPTFVSGDHYRAMFERLVTMPRREALTAMAGGIKASQV